MALDPAKLVYKWIQIIASHNHSVRDVADAASLVNDGRVLAIISQTAPIQEANVASPNSAPATRSAGSCCSGEGRGGSDETSCVNPHGVTRRRSPARRDGKRA